MNTHSCIHKRWAWVWFDAWGSSFENIYNRGGGQKIYTGKTNFWVNFYFFVKFCESLIDIFSLTFKFLYGSLKVNHKKFMVGVRSKFHIGGIPNQTPPLSNLSTQIYKFASLFQMRKCHVWLNGRKAPLGTWWPCSMAATSTPMRPGTGASSINANVRVKNTCTRCRSRKRPPAWGCGRSMKGSRHSLLKNVSPRTIHSWSGIKYLWPKHHSGMPNRRNKEM